MLHLVGEIPARPCCWLSAATSVRGFIAIALARAVHGRK
jgi:hypothetical protein